MGYKGETPERFAGRDQRSPIRWPAYLGKKDAGK
jgi:hypothetical protein